MTRQRQSPDCGIPFPRHSWHSWPSVRPFSLLTSRPLTLSRPDPLDHNHLSSPLLPRNNRHRRPSHSQFLRQKPHQRLVRRAIHRRRRQPNAQRNTLDANDFGSGGAGLDEDGESDSVALSEIQSGASLTLSALRVDGRGALSLSAAYGVASRRQLAEVALQRRQGSSHACARSASGGGQRGEPQGSE